MIISYISGCVGASVCRRCVRGVVFTQVFEHAFTSIYGLMDALQLHGGLVDRAHSHRDSDVQALTVPCSAKKVSCV